MKQHLTAVVLLAAGFAGCGPGTPPDRYADLIADSSTSDVDAVRQVAWGIKKIGGVGGGKELATVTEDAGRPVVSIRFSPDISATPEQIVVVGKDGTVQDARTRDLSDLSLNLNLCDFDELMRVGAARHLARVEFVVWRTVATPEGDRPVELLRAVLPRDAIERLAALPRDQYGSVDIDVTAHWKVDFDHYDEIVER